MISQQITVIIQNLNLEILCILILSVPLQVKKRGPTAVITSLAKCPRIDSTEDTSQSRSIFQYLES